MRTVSLGLRHLVPTDMVLGSLHFLSVDGLGPDHGISAVDDGIAEVLHPLLQICGLTLQRVRPLTDYVGVLHLSSDLAHEICGGHQDTGDDKQHTHDAEQEEHDQFDHQRFLRKRNQKPR